MLNEKMYKKEIVRMWDTLRGDEYKIYEYKIYNACNGVSCSKCPLHGVGCSEPLSSYEVVEIVKKWSKENPPKKFKVSRMEYDFLELFIFSGLDTYHFDQDDLLISLFRKGYFKGANEKMTIAYYFYNCEVDCELGGNENVKR